MSKYLPTNCPNCGAVLENGKCNYCGTKVVLANTVDVPENEMCDMILQFKKGNTTNILPLRGRIESIDFTHNIVHVSSLEDKYPRRIITAPTTVSFEFCGFIKEIDND